MSLRASLCAGLIVLAACGGGGDPPTEPGPAPVATVVVSPPATTLAPQQTVQLTAALRDAAGNSLSGRSIAWSASPSQGATVSGTGLVTAIAAGVVTVTATSEGKSGSAQVTVIAPVASVVLSAATTTLVPQQTLPLTVVLKDAGGAILTGRNVGFTSSQTAVATVNSAGTVTALAEGSTTITAISEGQSGTIDLTVATGAVIGPSGGSLTAGNGTITVTIPPGAVSTATPITLVQVAPPTTAPPTNVQFNGPAFALGPAGQAFTQPVTIALKYSAATMPAWAMTGDVAIYLSNGAQWTALTNVVVDSAAGTVTGQTTALGASATSLRLRPDMAAAAGDGSTVTTGVADPTINLTPTVASVNFQQRSVSFDVSLSGTGNGILKPAPGPTPTPQWKFRWRTTGAHGVLGGGGTTTGWTTSSREQYIANDPNLNGLTGPIDQVFVDVLLNPAEENNPSAQRIITAQQTVDADLQITYEISPDLKTIGPGVAQAFQLVMRDRQGNFLQPQPNHRIKWASSSNQGTLAGGNQVTSTYTSNSTFTTPPPRVDDIEVEIEGLTFVQERVVTWDLLSVPGVPQMIVTMKPKEERKLEGKAKAFVTVKVDYQVTLSPGSSTISANENKQLQVTVTPPYNGPGFEYKYTLTGTHGTLDVTNGTRTTKTTVTYTAKGPPNQGTDQIAVEVVSVVANVQLESVATGQASVQVDGWALASFTVVQLPSGGGASTFTAAQIRIPKAAGATSYEVSAPGSPDGPYATTFGGATSTNQFSVFQVLDGGSYWAINVAGGFNTIPSAAASRAALYQSMYGSVQWKYRAQ